LLPVNLIRLPEVLRRRGISRSVHFRTIDAGLWPEPVRISVRSVAWPDNEVNTLISAQIAGMSQADMRALVRELIAARSRHAPLLAA
jgi:prophage regulatory protein